MSDTTPPHPGWARPSLHLRLSKERLANLLALAVGLPDGCAPSDAVDRAIEVALASRKSESTPTEARFDDLDDAIDRFARQSAIDARKHEEIAREAARNVKELRDLISAVAGSASFDENDISEPIPDLRAWLDAESTNIPKCSLLAKAQWHNMTRIDFQHVSVELLVEVVALAELGQARQAVPGRPSLIRVPRIRAAHTLVRADLFPSLYLVCSRGDRGWQVATHEINPRGGIGQLTDNLEL